jgi:hypothetical protein
MTYLWNRELKGGKSERKKNFNKNYSQLFGETGKGSSSSYPSEHLGIILAVEKYREYDLHQTTRNLKIGVTRMEKEEKGEEEEKEGVFWRKKTAKQKEKTWNEHEKAWYEYRNRLR